MTEKSLARLVHEAKRELAPAPRRAAPRLPIKIDLPGAKVFLLRGRYRDAAYVKRHVAYVLTRGAEQGETHIAQNLNCIRQNLQEMGIDSDVIDQEVRSIAAAVRAELWRQVLTPDGDR
jgi:hypothetical protein